MAVSTQQQARIRKFVYAGLIVALYTISLLHRRLLLEPQADALQLREVSKGEVKLTDSAVRLALTGSRGFAVTYLWSTAIETQMKHEWNKLDLLVTTITQLQPHFITPWLYQGWNLAFNVAVECDRPRDKYYFVSRGVEVLAEGERRNYKPPAPGNPDMRQNLGFYYQLKIGGSDEKNTMRCLLDMSCIDPLERAPDRLWVDTDRGKKVILDKFKDFCTQHPRLVRRLHDQLGLTTPEAVVKFLDDNRDVPSRFEIATGGLQQKESPVKDELEQFPILPPGRTNPKAREISTTEAVDIYYICRTWYEYAQKPLPPPSSDPSDEPKRPNPLVKRLPRYIAQHIFRGYPARAQAYLAENLEAEGWFDGDGWTIKKWFDKLRGPNEALVRVGAGSKFHAGLAWDAAYRKYLEYGTRNGLYMTPAEEAELEHKAELFRQAQKLEDAEIGPSWDNVRQGKMGESRAAHRKLYYSRLYQNMTNYPTYIVQTDVERDPETVAARKYLYNADRVRKEDQDPERAIPLYQKAWELWAQVFLAHPRFAHLTDIQEDIYEKEFFNMRYVQKHRSEVFTPVLTGMAQLANWPYPPYDDLLEPGQKNKIVPVRDARGFLEYVLFYDGPHGRDLKMALAAFTNGAQLGPHFVSPTEVIYQLTLPIARGESNPPNFRTMVDADTIRRVRDRIGWYRLEKKEKERQKDKD